MEKMIRVMKTTTMRKARMRSTRTMRMTTKKRASPLERPLKTKLMKKLPIKQF